MSLEPHRPVFAVATAIAVPLLVLVTFFYQISLYGTFGYPLLALYLTWVLWALLKGKSPTKALMGATFWVLTIFWLGAMTFHLYANADLVSGLQRLTPELYMVFIVLSIMAHLVFSTRTALRASLGILTGTILVSIGWLATQTLIGAYLEPLVRLLTYEGALAIAILMLYGLSKSKDDHSQALLENERVRNMAYVDAVTDLPNRRRLEEDLERHVSLTERHDHPLSVILFDIDRFKEVNDRHGHKAGDRVLEATGRLVRSLLRAGDVFGRWGGEEFLVIAPETSKEQGTALAERIREAIEQYCFPTDISVTASFGIATCSEGAAIDTLVEQADMLLYQAKQAGRNRVVS